MTLYISVVSHNHDDMIANSDTLQNLAKNHKVVIKANTQPTESLINYCNESDIYLLVGTQTKGFGANNNEVFRYAELELCMSEDDFFLVLNPDVDVSVTSINNLLDCARKDNSPISTINLYRDKDCSIYDNAVRKFPSLLNPIKSLLGIKRDDYYDKSQINVPTLVDWAAGSFLLFQSKCFKELDGFDERYFMYFEDADICKRAHKQSNFVTYYPHISAIHYAAFENRNIFNKHSVYYLRSYSYYFLSLTSCQNT